MFFMDSQTTEPIWTKYGMLPTYNAKMLLDDISMTLAHSNRPGSIATKPYSDRFWPSLGRNPSNSRVNLLDHIKERAKNLIGQPLANKPLLPLPSRRYVAFLGALFYYYYFGRWNSTLSESVPKPKVFSRGTRRANPRWQPVHSQPKFKSLLTLLLQGVHHREDWQTYLIYRSGPGS